MSGIPDWRHIANGQEIPTINYSDQPYVVKTDDGAWLCCVTTGAGREGQPGQTVAAMRSTDRGKTWSEPLFLEPTDGPEAAYAVLLKAPSGRVYAFYNYNIDNIREVIADDPPWKGGKFFRVDSLGAFVYRYSDDHGRSWSPERRRIPIRNFEIDRNNPYGGDIQFFWNVGKPVVCDNTVLVSIHKIGRYGFGSFALSEGAFVASDNILTECDPDRIHWETLPEGDIGLRAPEGSGSDVAEEQSTVCLSDGSLYCVYRTVAGHAARSISRDGGRSWSAPDFQRFSDGRPMKHPRAANFVWRCANGKYLYWFHNHGGRFVPLLNREGYEDRNPVWVCAGREIDTDDGKTIQWSEPEILLYDDDPYIRMSYPDLVEEDGDYYVTETQKDHARTHPVPSAFLETLWGQFERSEIAQDSLVLQLPEKNASEMPRETGAPELPRFSTRDTSRADHAMRHLRTGFSIDLQLASDASGILLDALSPDGRGWRLAATPEGAAQLTMCDGQTHSVCVSEPGLLGDDTPHALTIVVDAGPRIVSFILDGRFCDGGDARQFGWQRFSPNLRFATGTDTLQVDSSVKALRIYSRALMTTEAIGNQRTRMP